MRGAGLRHVAIDGQAVRAAPGATSRGRLHPVSAWAAEDRLVLGQRAVADGPHEIAAVPELLKAMALKGALATLDAAVARQEWGPVSQLTAELQRRDGAKPAL